MDIEKYVITSSRKVDGKWFWTRDNKIGAMGLARQIAKAFFHEGHKYITVTVLEVETGTVIAREFV